MKKINEYLEIIENELSQTHTIKRSPAELYEPISYILSLGGKRIRPVLALISCNLFTDSISQAIKPAVALEIFHNFTLLHDDIMDNAPLRRAQPTVHEKWNTNIAILSGDAMQIIAYQKLCDCDAKLLKPLINIFNTTALEVCEGQQYDMNYALSQEVLMSEYLRMIELKTSVLIAASIKVGAICGGADPGEADKLYEFGRNLGIAFQIQDDYLDVFGNKTAFGKSVGGDIVENKKTFLLIKALELATGDMEITLKNALNNVRESSEKIAIVKQAYELLNIPEITLKAIDSYAQKAFEYLSLVNVPNERKVLMADIATQIMTRNK